MIKSPPASETIRENGAAIIARASDRDIPMKRKRTVKITTTRRRQLSLDQIVIRLQCPVCGHEVETRSLAQAEAVSVVTDAEANPPPMTALRLAAAARAPKPSR
jgi:hypothetical protein